jgi:hypothetical protein
MNRRRLEAEPLRDAMLALSGELDRTMGGSLTGTNNPGPPDMANMAAPPESKRRSVYLPVIRNNVNDLFQVFDFPDPHVVTGKRHATTAPTQALFMLNSPFVLQQSKRWAESLLGLRLENERERIAAAYMQSLGRPPAGQETERALTFLAKAAGRSDASLNDQAAWRSRAWQQFCHALLASTEFRFLN